jgi:hypothetical protein
MEMEMAGNTQEKENIKQERYMIVPVAFVSKF